MPITVIVGAQFGGEGKGKIANHLARSGAYHAFVRCGGPNSGHTVVSQGQTVVLRQLPAAVVRSRGALYIPAGGIVDMDVLRNEMDAFGVSDERLRIDPSALILDRADSESEAATELGSRIGSTCTGTGAGVARRVSRGAAVRLAGHIGWMERYLTDVASELASMHRDGAQILIEGTQGFGLSLYHSRHYPYATSRDTTAAAFLSETGLGPLWTDRIIMVVRTFPIRVEGQSGPVKDEIDWGVVQRESGYPYAVSEMTSVTQKLRRIGRFDAELVARAADANSPTELAVTGLDYLDYRSRGATRWSDLTLPATEFVERAATIAGVPATFLSTGPDEEEIIDLSSGD